MESKLQTLKSEKAVCNYSDQGSSAAESSGKAASRDGSSAGSFTRVAQTNRVLQCRIVDTEAAEDSYIKHVVLVSSLSLEKFPSIGVNIRRRRGNRRRKDSNKEGNEGHDQNLGTSKQTRPVSLFDTNGPKQSSSKQGMDDFIKIFDFVTQNEHAAVFRRRLDSQV